MKTKYTTFYFNDIDIEVCTTYEWRTDYPDCPEGFWQEVKREIVCINAERWINITELEDEILSFVDKAKIEL